MKFRSTHPSQPLSFEFAGRQYDVPVGETCEIEDKWLPWVISRGLMLEEAVDSVALPAMLADVVLSSVPDRNAEAGSGDVSGVQSEQFTEPLPAKPRKDSGRAKS